MIEAIALQEPASGTSASRDRRGSPRFRISLPLSIQSHRAKRDAKEFSGETVNMSGRGVYLVTDKTVEWGATLSLTIILPHKKISPPIVTRARVRAVRSERIWHQGLQRVGVAAEIEYFSV